MDKEFGEVWVFWGTSEVKSVIFFVKFRNFLDQFKNIRNGKVGGAEWRRAKISGESCGCQTAQRTMTTLKIFESKSDSFVLYVIWWLDFNGIISQWSDDIL